MGEVEVVDKIIAAKRLEDRIAELEATVQKIQNKMEQSGTESTKVFAEVREKFRLMGQEINHLNSVTFPAYWEQEIREMKDEIYNTKQMTIEEVSRWKAFRENHFFEAVTYEEVLNLYKMSGVTLKELADECSMDISGVSRLMNGDRKRDNPMAFHKIKQYCLTKMGVKK